MKCFLRIMIAFVGVISFVSSAFAFQVNLKNLNFYVSSQDYYLPCYGFNTEINRSYNSKSYSIDSPFGLGWTHNLNVYLVERDGFIEIYEEDGFRGEYVPEGMQDEFKKKIIEAIISFTQDQHKKSEGRLRSKKFYKSLKTKLRRDTNYYLQMKRKYIQSRGEAKNGKYFSTSRGKSTLTKTSKGYVRENLAGRKDYFNINGNLVGKVDRNENRVNFQYDDLKRLAAIKDSCKRTLSFKYHPKYKSKVSKIFDSFGRQLQYKYDKKERLVRFIDANGQITDYRYNKQGLLGKLKLPDEKGPLLINYSKDRFGEVDSLKRADGKITKYTVKIDPRDKTHYWTNVKDNKGYERRVEYLEKEYKTIDQEKGKPTKITTFTACCGKPLSITDKKGVGRFFDYDKKDNMRRQFTSEGKTMEYEYEDSFNQIRRVRSSDGLDVGYEYDKNGNLKTVTNHKSQTNTSGKDVISIKYYAHGKMKTIEKEKGDTIRFEYNYYSKPTVIENDRLGKILVTYDDFGSVTEITGEASRKNKEDKDKKEELIQKIKISLLDMLKLLKPTGLDFGI